MVVCWSCVLTITAFVVIVGATVIALMNDKRDRAKQRERQSAFEYEPERKHVCRVDGPRYSGPTASAE